MKDREIANVIDWGDDFDRGRIIVENKLLTFQSKKKSVDDDVDSDVDIGFGLSVHLCCLPTKTATTTATAILLFRQQINKYGT